MHKHVTHQSHACRCVKLGEKESGAATRGEFTAGLCSCVMSSTGKKKKSQTNATGCSLNIWANLFYVNILDLQCKSLFDTKNPFSIFISIVGL